jgi:hypothetical protein
MSRVHVEITLNIMMGLGKDSIESETICCMMDNGEGCLGMIGKIEA